MDLDRRMVQAAFFTINEAKPRGGEIDLHGSVQEAFLTNCSNPDDTLKPGRVTLDKHERTYFAELLAKQAEAGVPGLMGLGFKQLRAAVLAETKE